MGSEIPPRKTPRERSTSTAPLSRMKRLEQQRGQTTHWWENPLRKFGLKKKKLGRAAISPPITQENAIVIRNLSQSFAGRRILHNINLTIPRGTLLGLIGPNGAGKTVTIRILAGLLCPSAGQIFLLDKPFSAWHSPPLGIVMEEPIIFPERTAIGNLEWFKQKTTHSPQKRNLQSLLEKVNIDPSNPQPVRNFSLGMRKRLNLAQALLDDPPILLLDEPLAAMDGRSRSMVTNLLQREASQGKAILWASAEAKSCYNACDRIAVLAGGRIRMEGTPEQIQKQWIMGPLRVNVTTTPLAKERLQSLRRRTLPHGATQWTLDHNQLTACVEDERSIPALLHALQEESIPIYGLHTTNPIDHSLFP